MIKALTGGNLFILILIGIITFFAISDKSNLKKSVKKTIEIAELKVEISNLKRAVAKYKADSTLSSDYQFRIIGELQVTKDTLSAVKDSLDKYRKGMYLYKPFIGKKRWRTVSFEKVDYKAELLGDAFMDYCNENKLRAGVLYEYLGYINKKSNLNDR